MKTFYKILTVLIGYGLIVASFILLFTWLPDDIRILDIVVTSIIYTQLVEFLFFPLIDLEKKAHKEVGMMGIHLAAINTYAGVAIVIMAVGMIWELSFTWQLLLQLGALLILIIGRVATLHSGEKVEAVYHQEQVLRGGKQQLKAAAESMMDAIVRSSELSPVLVSRIRQMAEDVRYVSPSTDAEALNLELQFTRLSSDLEVVLRQSPQNNDQIAETVGQLEYILAKRKKY